MTGNSVKGLWADESSSGTLINCDLRGNEQEATNADDNPRWTLVDNRM